MGGRPYRLDSTCDHYVLGLELVIGACRVGVFKDDDAASAISLLWRQNLSSFLLQAFNQSPRYFEHVMISVPHIILQCPFQSRSGSDDAHHSPGSPFKTCCRVCW